MSSLAQEAAPRPAARAAQRPLSGLEVALMVAGSAWLLGATWMGWWPLSLTEALGFATGGTCVWLCVREHIWNWPLGLANNVIFFVLFGHSRLYADMGLQSVYFAFGVYGWWNWLYGGQQHGALNITRTPRLEALALAALGMRNLSMRPASIGPVKAMVRAMHAGDTAAMLDELLAAKGATASFRPQLLQFAQTHELPL